MKAGSNRCSLPIAIIATLILSPVLAEEGGAGHYAPGAAASFFDALPGQPGWAVANYFLYYDGSASGRLPIGGQLTLDARAQAYSDSVMIIYDTNLKVFGGHYVPAVALPYVWVEVDGTITGPLGPLRTRDSADGLGDMLIYPVMLGWKYGDLKYDLRLGLYAPTGDFEKGRLANVGKNYWTFEPMVSASWLSSKIGTEVSAFAGVGFSTRNDTTDYQSGDVFHLDATIAQHLPLGKLGAIGVGANAFYYQQFTGDSGRGAFLGDFKGRTVGVGPVLSFVTKLGKTDLAAELKWLPELEVNNRLEGDYFWFKLGLVF